MSTAFTLKPGDEIRVIAPSQSWSGRKRHRGYERARARLESLGYVVTFSENIRKTFSFGTATRQERADDFNAAYQDKNVRLVMALTGGWSANEILPFIDWELIKSNPKPLIGFSDITVLLNAIYAKTGQHGYLGPNFSTLGRMPEWRYTVNNFQATMSGEPTLLEKSIRWGTRGLRRYRTTPWKVMQKGEAKATLIGGNLGTFYLLQGTDYQPKFDQPFIFALEDDDEAMEYTAMEVSRRFESLLQLSGFRQNLRGLLIGRFEPKSKISPAEIENIIVSQKLNDIPIASNIDFGHTLPMLTLPIGVDIKLSVSKHVTIEALQ